MILARLFRPLGAVCFLVWIAFVLASFYAVQKPLNAQDAPDVADGLAAFASAPAWGAIADAFLNFATAVFIGFAAICAGTRIGLFEPSAVCQSSISTRAEYWIVRAGLGFGIVSLGTFLLALLGALELPILLLFSVGLILVGGRTTLRTLRVDLPVLTMVRLPIVLSALLGVSILLSLLSALSPPTAWDALVYHLTVPARALVRGQLSPLNDIIPHENFPLFMSSLYLLAMGIKGDIAAQCLHWLFGFLTLALLALTARRFYGPAAVPYAIVLSLSVPMLLLLSAWAYDDVALAFYIVAAVYCYGRWRDTNRGRYLTAAACMTGFAMGLKYTSFVLPLGIFALAAWEMRRRAIRPILTFGLVAGLVAAPWYLKNLIFTGNPVYPFLFGGDGWDNLRAVWYARPGTGIGFDLLTLMTLPVTMTLGYRDANFFDGRTGPLLLMMLPVLWLNRPRVDRFVATSLLFFAFWTAGVMGTTSLWQSRLLLPALLLLIPPLAGATSRLRQYDQPSFSLRRIVTTVAILVLGVNLFTQVVDFAKLNPVAFIVGAETREHFVLRQLGTHAAAMTAVNQLPTGARVQFMWEPRSYLAQRAVRADPLLDALPHLVLTTGSVGEGVRLLKAEGFTHVLVWEAGAKFAIDNLRDRFGERDAQDLKQLESDYARVVYENSAYRLLELK
jgi:Dolichyl-phosphate-mannose-protein mannosyltransferase